MVVDYKYRHKELVCSSGELLCSLSDRLVVRSLDACLCIRLGMEEHSLDTYPSVLMDMVAYRSDMFRLFLMGTMVRSLDTCLLIRSDTLAHS